MVNAKDAVLLYRRLLDHHIQIWLTGGWGIDALLGQQTRPHKDLDAILSLDNMVQMCEILGKEGFELKELWSENSWVIDAEGNKTATAFVLQDPEGREFDAHAIRFDAQGNGTPAWIESEDFIFTKEDLTGIGKIAGYLVKSISPECQVRFHIGYKLPEKQVLDIEMLQSRFGVKVPILKETGA
jgi:lincosamide nucleotidyltransferase A/C/D/E